VLVHHLPVAAAPLQTRVARDLSSTPPGRCCRFPTQQHVAVPRMVRSGTSKSILPGDDIEAAPTHRADVPSMPTTGQRHCPVGRTDTIVRAMCSIPVQGPSPWAIEPLLVQTARPSAAETSVTWSRPPTSGARGDDHRSSTFARPMVSRIRALVAIEVRGPQHRTGRMRTLLRRPP